MTDADQLGSRRSRRRLLRTLAGTVAVASAGCVTTGLSVRAEGVSESNVFSSFSSKSSLSWGGNRAWVSASLTDAATTRGKVRTLTVVPKGGTAFWTGTLSGGETSATMSVPVGKPVTVNAIDATDALVDSVRLLVRGTPVP
ncbi:hypothetical protein ACFQPA_00700 [Halomarina halobia]|uniref:Twin-arginine translocation signal domain-containing protein n=1 Tax=Halomarina halobia TaxID=3033386 RepID=A0ABD6A7S4_9EURY|nr:hypothetical protein [Halomarina sp. PSR21]